MGIKDDINNAEAVIFDLDGTIVDSMWMWGNIDIEYLSIFGIKCPDDLQKCIEGMSFYETAVYFKDRFSLSDDILVIMNQWNDMAYEKYKSEVPLKEGFLDFISYLHNHGYKLGVATSNSRRLANVALEAHGLSDFFHAVLTGDECGKGKPEPDVYLETAKRLDVQPEKCLVFEDLPAGITAGKRAGMKTVAVEDTYSARSREEKKKLADYYINDYREIINEIHNP